MIIPDASNVLPGRWMAMAWVILFQLAAGGVPGATLHVSPVGGHQAPYATWATAAVDIQSAIDAAADGDLVLVTNGVYDTGGTVVQQVLTNRIAITRALTVRSVNGPAYTVIEGEGPVGDDAIRCAYIGNGARLEGFTLTNGHTRRIGEFEGPEGSGGGAWCAPNGVVSNCVLTGNGAWIGGGFSGGVIRDSHIVGNQAYAGGGAVYATLVGCEVSENVAEGFGGGVSACIVESCTIMENVGASGGGAHGGTNRNSMIRGNTAQSGGGMAYSLAWNCAIIENVASSFGGGAYEGEMRHCTVLGNTSGKYGGGVVQGVVEGCIVYDNTALLEGDNMFPELAGTVSHSCTLPDPGGIGNITEVPRVAGIRNPHLLKDSPCIDAAVNRLWMLGARDLDDEARIKNGKADMGCDEVHPDALAGEIDVAIHSDADWVTVETPVHFGADTAGRPIGIRWSWGEGDQGLTNEAWASHTFGSPGDYEVVLEAWNLDGTWSATHTVHVVEGFTNYVSPSGAHVPPFARWADAATNIQAAIEHNIPGGIVLVTNGVFASGEHVARGNLGNRIAVTKPVTVRSVNGPAYTSIVGQGPVGSNAVRCAYLGRGARLEGLTLTGGHTRTGYSFVGEGQDFAGGGAWCEPGAVLSNCVVTANGASEYGGGVFGGTVESSTVSDNTTTRSSLSSGGGAAWSTLRDSVITGNVSGKGGGLAHCIAATSTISSNEADRGGGVTESTVNRCVLLGNRAAGDGSSDGGGALFSDLVNSFVYGNTSEAVGGGANGGTMENCTVVRNVAGFRGGGTDGGTILNSIVYYNSAPQNANSSSTNVSYTCIAPDPGGIGIITEPPGLAGLDNPHLVRTAPCVDAGTNRLWMIAAKDIDGELRLRGGRVDLGCDEVFPLGMTGPLEVRATAAHTNASVGFSGPFEAGIQGRPMAFWWDWGDGSTETNTLLTGHAYAEPGDYLVVLTAWNLSGATSVTTQVHIAERNTNYVSQAGTHVPPFDSWATAATNIQSAISAQSVPGGLVLVADGVYDQGHVVVVNGSFTNRVALTNGVTVRSTGGPSTTRIVGSGGSGGSVRCAYLGENTRLEGFALVDGVAGGRSLVSIGGGGAYCEPSALVIDCLFADNIAASGGGIYQGTASNCTFTGNHATRGGAAYEATLLNCVITNNVGVSFGGGTYGGTVRNSFLGGNSVDGAWSGGAGGGVCFGVVENCTILGNQAPTGGGAYDSLIRNSIVYYNSSGFTDDNHQGCIMEYSCTDPLPDGIGNLIQPPGILGLQNPRIVETSPCVDAGVHLPWVGSASDLDGEPRLWGTAVDIGCDEVHPGGLIGPLIVTIRANYTSVREGFPLVLEAAMEGRAAGYQWGIDSTPEPGTLRIEPRFTVPGDYAVTLGAWNLDGSQVTTTRIEVVAGWTNYVSPSGSHTAPFETWATAATNIQTAIDAHTLPGGTVLVGDGTYDTGQRVVGGNMVNRIAITNGTTVRSLHGPDHTVLVGRGPPGEQAVRCAYVGDYGCLEGFTLTQGHAGVAAGGYDLDRQLESGGGAWCESNGRVRNCRIQGNAAFLYGGGVYGGQVENCVVAGNRAPSGGGAAFGALQGCLVAGNQATSFGGGGGVFGARVANSVLDGNTADNGYGGGASLGTLDACVISRNRALYGGGGASDCTLRNCLVVDNLGGGTHYGAAENCTIVGNVASSSGGGTLGTRVLNSIVFGNSTSLPGPNSNWVGGPIDFTCTFPRPDGAGNLMADPQFVDLDTGNFRLQAASPCIDAAEEASWMTGSNDLDGNPRISGATADMGAYESVRMMITGSWYTASGHPAFAWTPDARGPDYTVESASALAGAAFIPVQPTNQWPIGINQWTNPVAPSAAAEFFRVTATYGYGYGYGNMGAVLPDWDFSRYGETSGTSTWFNDFWPDSQAGDR